MDKTEAVLQPGFVKADIVEKFDIIEFGRHS